MRASASASDDTLTEVMAWTRRGRINCVGDATGTELKGNVPGEKDMDIWDREVPPHEALMLLFWLCLRPVAKQEWKSDDEDGVSEIKPCDVVLLARNVLSFRL